MQKLLNFFSKKFQYICVSLNVNFNESLTNDVVSFEQLGPVCFPVPQSSEKDLLLDRKFFPFRVDCFSRGGLNHFC